MGRTAAPLRHDRRSSPKPLCVACIRARQIRQNRLLDARRLTPKPRYPAGALSLDGLPVAEGFPEEPRVMQDRRLKVQPDGFLAPDGVRSPREHLLPPATKSL